MAVLHYGRREIRSRVAYFGPVGSGKASNLQALQALWPVDRRGAVVESVPESERTVRCMRLPILGDPVGDWSVRFEALTIPGQALFPSTRANLLAGADGVVFVADAAPARREANVASWHELLVHVVAQGVDPDRMPIVIQVNHADVPDALGVADVAAQLAAETRPAFPAVARDGRGVLEAWTAVEGLVRVGWRA
ncbi:MAG: hypothetical protein VKP57_10635 [Candidatus Sericytochromatia bacterium]|nr:hypothetical protein [Candidatus Sericytochromatia bacterium]